MKHWEIERIKLGEIEGWKSGFSGWNECYFACKSCDLRTINRAVLDKILAEIRDKTIRSGGLDSIFSSWNEGNFACNSGNFRVKIRVIKRTYWEEKEIK